MNGTWIKQYFFLLALTFSILLLSVFQQDRRAVEQASWERKVTPVLAVSSEESPSMPVHHTVLTSSSFDLRKIRSETVPGKFISQENSMTVVNIVIDGKTFIARFYNNETTKALISKMPFTIPMSDMNGNEKYYRLPRALPTPNTVRPATIRAGEIMCWSSNTLVIFYETFSNSYNGYVRLGYIENMDALASALENKNVVVTFSLQKPTRVVVDMASIKST